MFSKRSATLVPPSRLPALLLVLATAPALAKPAPWYLWQSRVDGHTLCLQSPPGEGWVRIGGPYRNIRCGR